LTYYVEDAAAKDDNAGAKKPEKYEMHIRKKFQPILHHR
jgi:hypothetical protein